MNLKFPLLALALTSMTTNAAVLLYGQDFQAMTAGTLNPDGWTGATRAFRAGGATTEDGANDTALIATGVGNYTTTKQLTVAIQPNTTYTLSLKAGFYSSAADATGSFLYSLGTTNGSTYTRLSDELTTSLNQATSNQYFFGAGNNIALPDLVFTTGASVSGDNLTISLRGTGNSFQGFDNIVLTSIPEPTATALFGLSALAIFARRRR